MRTLLIIACLFTLTFTSCEKTGYLNEGSGTYDTANRIFRIKASSPGSNSYTVSIKRAKQNGGSTQTVDNILANQETGIAFEYGFTPAIGETITVVVKSLKNDIKPFAFYKGEHTFPIEMKQTAGEYTGELVYKVED